MKESPFKNTPEAVAKNLDKLKKIKSQGLSKNAESTRIRQTLFEFANGKWDLTQDILLDVIVAGHIEVAMNKRKVPYSCPETLKLAEQEIRTRYGENEELCEIIIEAIPSVKTLQRWLKRNDWKDEIESRLKGDSLFSLDRRAVVINMIYDRAVDERDLKAAETYLKLSGDLTNQPKQKDKGYEAYQELAASLIKKNKD